MDFPPHAGNPTSVLGVNEFPKHASDDQTAMPGRQTPALFIHEEDIGLDVTGERDGFGFAGIEREWQRENWRRRFDLQPALGERYGYSPAADRVAQGRQFRSDRRRNLHRAIPAGEKIEPANDGEIGERRSVTYDAHGRGLPALL